MARKSMIEKANRKPKYSTRLNRRCEVCGRSRAYYRKFRMCRICLREFSSKGQIPGLAKSSW